MPTDVSPSRRAALRPAAVGTLVVGLLIGALFTGLLRAAPGATAAPVTDGHSTVFTAGEAVPGGGGSRYACFRAPAVVRAATGVLLAFAEGRIGACGDSGRNDVVLKRSHDGGATWVDFQVVARHRLDAGGGLAAYAHNAAPVVDARTGRVVLLYTEDYERVYVRLSDTHGATWQTAREITPEVWDPAWGPLYGGQMSTGPAHGIQLTRGEHAGRLVVAATVRLAPGRYRTDPLGGALLYSDDGGQRWRAGASSHGGEPAVGVQEPTLFERGDGSLFVIARNEEGDAGTVDRAAWAVSRDQGETFDGDFRLLPPLSLPANGVQTSSLAIRTRQEHGYDRALLAAPVRGGPDEGRVDLTIRSSFDGGATWQEPADGALVREGHSAYSDLVDLTGGRFGVLYEGGTTAQYQFVRFGTFTEADLDLPADPGRLTAQQANGALTTTGPDQTHLFAPTPGGALGHWFPEADGTVRRGTWGDGVAGEAAAFAYGAQQHVLVRGADGALLHRFWDPGRGAVAAQTWLPAGTAAGAPAALVTPGQQHAFVRAADGRLLHHWWDAGSGSRHGQTWAPAGTLAGDPVAVAYDRQQHVWAAGADGGLHHWWWTPGGAGVRHEQWAGQARGTPAAFVHRGQLHVFAADASRRLGHWWWDPDTQAVHRQTWAAPVPLAGRPSAFAHGTQQHVYARTADGALGHWWWDAGYDAPRYAVLAGAIGSDPVAHLAGGTQHVFGAGPDGGLVHWWWNSADGNRSESWGGQVAPTAPW